MKLLHIIGIAISAIALSSCTDSDDLNIGGSLTAENDKIDATSANFAVSTRTIQTGNILSRSNECYFGRIQDPETGATVTSEFMSQFGSLRVSPSLRIIIFSAGMTTWLVQTLVL